MKLFLFLSCFLAIAMPGFSQIAQKQVAKFTILNRFYNDTVCGQSWGWTINKKKVKGVKGGMEIAVNFPAIDTVVATNKKTKEKRVILTRFVPGCYYDLEAESCDNALEIFIPERVQKHNALYDSIDKLPSKKQERAWWVVDSVHRSNETPLVIFKVVNAAPTDSIGATFGDIHIGYTTGCLLKNAKQDTICNPFYIEASGHCYQAKVAKVSRTGVMSEDPYKQRTYFTRNGFMESPYFVTEEFFSLYLRFFNREKVLVTYDAKKKKTKIEILE